MKKESIIFGILLLSVAVSCGFLRKGEAVVPQEDANNSLSQQQDPTPHLHVNTPEHSGEKINKTQESDHDKKLPEIAPHYDSAALDDQVRQEAKKLGKDPATYRMLVRIDADGAKIYRQIGMHVIVAPGNEEVLLPDEI